MVEKKTGTEASQTATNKTRDPGLVCRKPRLNYRHNRTLDSDVGSPSAPTIGGSCIHALCIVYQLQTIVTDLHVDAVFTDHFS